MEILSRCEPGILAFPAVMCPDQKVNGFPEISALHNTVNDAVVQKKFRRLESLRQFLAYGLSDHPLARKSDQRTGLCHDHVPQHGKAGRDPSHGGIREYGAVQQSCFTQFLYRRRSLCHLHQGDDSFLHPGPSRTAEKKNRQSLFQGPLQRGSDFFAYNMPHTGHQKPGITDAQHNILTENPALAHGKRLVQPCFIFGLHEFFFVSLIGQGIVHGQIRKPRFKCMGICHHADPVGHFDPEISLTFITDIFSSHHPLAFHHLPAPGAFDLIDFLFLCRCRRFFLYTSLK